jgi:uncharacterized protein YkwD
MRYWRLGVIGCLGVGAALASAGGDASAFKQTANEMNVFALTNAERKQEDVPALKLNPALSKIARAHSENMVRQGKMAHDLDDRTPFDRLRAAGYQYKTAGENVALGTGNVSLPMLMKGWMDSEGHRKNILEPEYTELGVGIASDPNGQVYFTQLFGKPRKK